MQTAFISYTNFAQKRAVENRNSSLALATRIGLSDSVNPLKDFIESYKQTNGFSEWLASMAGLELTAGQWRIVVAAYLKSGRKVTEIPFIISSITRMHNIELPAVYGIATLAYWEEKFPNKHAA